MARPGHLARKLPSWDSSPGNRALADTPHFPAPQHLQELQVLGGEALLFSLPHTLHWQNGQDLSDLIGDGGQMCGWVGGFYIPK